MVHSLHPLSPGMAQEDPTYSTAERDRPRQLPTVNYRGQYWIILRENEGHIWRERADENQNRQNKD